MKKARYFIHLAFCIGAFSANAQEVYNLKRCIEIGLERNYAIRIVRNEQQISTNNATPGNAGYLPSLDLSSEFGGTITDTQNKLRAGGTEKTTGVNNETANLGVSLNWTLFDGLGIQTQYARLKELQSMGALNTRLTIEDFMADMAGEYYHLIREKNRLHNLSSTLNLSKERLRIVEERYNIGSMSRLDWQQAHVYFNADSSKLLNQLEVVHRSQTRLKELMSFDNLHAEVQLADSVIEPNPLLVESDLWEHATEQNVLVLMAKKNQVVSALDYKKAKSRNYPYLKLNAGYGHTSNWYELGTTERQRRLGANYGLTLGYNLFDGFNRRREQRNARIQIQNSELRKHEIALGLQTDMSNQWMAYKNNLNLWNLEKENLIAAQENYDIAIERYKLGDLSGIELREAQNSLLEAEERRSIAEYATKICEISLLQLSGQIMTDLTR